MPAQQPAPAILSLIGNTPLIELTRFDTGPCRLFVKLENTNPAGSIKDRLGRSLIEAAERDGRLKPGGTIIEATAGNTGLGLTLVASAKGYRIVLVIPDKMAVEKIAHLRAMGAEIRMTRSDVGKGHPEYYQDVAQRLADETPNSVYINQFSNPANPEAHETTTGPEIWQQMGHEVDAVVVGVGSGGTLTGLGRFFQRVSPQTQMVLADPKGSILADLVKTGKHGDPGSWVIEGIGEDFVPDVCDLSFVRDAFTIDDQESLTTARELLQREGILGGSSTGTLLAAALRWCRQQTEPKRVVTFVCDTGNKYLSKQYSDFWMAEQGWLPRNNRGNLMDLISRPHDNGGTVVVTPEDTLLTAYKRMRVSDVSQLPVLDPAGQMVGLVDESDILMTVLDDPGRFKRPVSSAMTTKLETIGPDGQIADLYRIFDRGYVAVVVENGKFQGLITRVDLLNNLRRKLP